jgi:hypothetical protein
MKENSFERNLYSPSYIVENPIYLVKILLFGKQCPSKYAKEEPDRIVIIAKTIKI